MEFGQISHSKTTETNSSEDSIHPYSLSIIRTRSEIKNDFKRSVSRSSGKTMEGQLPSAFSVRSPAWKTLCLLEEVGFLLAGGKGYSYHLNRMHVCLICEKGIMTGTE